MPPKKYPTILRGWANLFVWPGDTELPVLSEIELRKRAPALLRGGKTAIKINEVDYPLVVFAFGQRLEHEGVEVPWSITDGLGMVPLGRFYFIAAEARLPEGLPVQFIELRGGTRHRAWMMWAGLEFSQVLAIMKVTPLGSPRDARLWPTTSATIARDKKEMIDLWRMS